MPDATVKRLVLLGAGASQPVGIPTAYAMTKEMRAAVQQPNVPKKVRHAFRVAVASLQFAQGLRDEDPTGEVNIEEVLNVLSTLEDRHTMEVSALIGAWHPIVEELDALTIQPNPSRIVGTAFADPFRNLDFERKVDRLAQVIENGVDRKIMDGRELRTALDQLLQDREQSRSNFGNRRQQSPSSQAREIPGMGKIYGRTRRLLIAHLKSLVWIGDDRDDKLHFLDPLVQAAACECFTIATLNYDNSVERVARRLGVRLDTGIQQWQDEGHFGSPDSKSVPFRKLHGSMNWALKDDKTSQRIPLPREVLTEVVEEEMNDAEYKPALIFGGRNKLTVRGPFLDLLRDFRDRLSDAKSLVVIGYSFTDDHINEYIAQWLNASENTVLNIVNGPSFAGEAKGFAKQLLKLGAPRVLDTKMLAQDGISEIFLSSEGGR